MKARLPIDKYMKQRIRKATAEAVAEQIDLQTKTMTRRFLKMLCIVLNSEYSFGKKRLANVIEKMGSLAIEAETDEVFWEHADRIVINQLGLVFEEDYTEETNTLTAREIATKKL